MDNQDLVQLVGTEICLARKTKRDVSDLLTSYDINGPKYNILSTYTQDHQQLEKRYGSKVNEIVTSLNDSSHLLRMAAAGGVGAGAGAVTAYVLDSAQRAGDYASNGFWIGAAAEFFLAPLTISLAYGLKSLARRPFNKELRILQEKTVLALDNADKLLTSGTPSPADVQEAASIEPH